MNLTILSQGAYRNFCVYFPVVLRAERSNSATPPSAEWADSCRVWFSFWFAHTSFNSWNKFRLLPSVNLEQSLDHNQAHALCFWTCRIILLFECVSGLAVNLAITCNFHSLVGLSYPFTCTSFWTRAMKSIKEGATKTTVSHGKLATCHIS